MFASEREPAAVIFDSIMSTPTAQVRRGTEWHIAAPESLGDFSVGFQIGRVQSVNTPQFDDILKRFFESDSERAPYTWGVFDGATQTCGICRRSGVSLDPYEVGGKLQKLLNESGIPEKSNCSIVVDVVKDPENFIEIMRSAHQVRKFSFTTHFENAHDVQKLIQRPAQEFNDLVGADKTKVEVEGESLDKVILEDLTRSVASVGDDAAASIKSDEKSRAKRIFLKGTPLTIEINIQRIEELFSEARSAVSAAYRHLRREPE